MKPFIKVLKRMKKIRIAKDVKFFDDIYLYL